MHEGPAPTPAIPHGDSEATTSAAADKDMPSGADTRSGATTGDTKNPPKKSVDEACSAILGAMQGKRDTAAADHCRKRPAAALPKAKGDKPEKCAKTETGVKVKGEKCGKLEKDVKPEKKDEKPSYSVERSRSQVLFRTGLKGAGQSTRFPYENGKEAEKAIKWRRAW